MRDVSLGAFRAPGALVLDMDGTMLDTEPLYKAAWQRAAADLGCALDDAFYLTLVGRSIADGEAELVRRFGPAFPIADFRSRWPAIWRTRVEAGGIPTKPGLLELLAWVEGCRLPVAVATSSDRAYAMFSLTSAGLAGRFETVVTGDEVAHGKPAPDIYFEAARRLGVRPAQAIAVEDSDAGTLSARRAGMSVLLIPDLKAPSAEAAAAASRVLESLFEARAFIATFEL
jgi:beta-phosphoglucomutase-like phosphatase (HAD superfamily)